MKKLILIDGHALIFKMYYAFLRRPMINSKGSDTSVLFGFTKTLLELLLKEKPTHLAVAFDPPAKTFRHEIFPDYKANRSETPELIKESLEPLCELMEALSIPVLMQEGFEADDVIGSFSKIAEKNGHTVYMVTPDKDYGQLVSDRIFQYKPGKSGSDHSILGKKEICSHYGIEDPAQVVDILTIWGDTSDNIPGVRGVGEVGARKLIAKYKNVENIYDNLENLPPKQREAFREASSYIELSKQLVTIKTDMPLPWNESSLELSTPDFSQITKLFSEYEFSSLTRMIPRLKSLFTLGNSDSTDNTGDDSFNEKRPDPWTLGSVEEVAEKTQKTKYISIILHNDTLMAGSDMRCISLPLGEPLPEPLLQIMEHPDIIKCGYDLKRLSGIVTSNNRELKGYLADPELMHYLISPESSHKQEALSKRYLGISSPEKIQPPDLFSSSTGEDQMQKALEEIPLLFPLTSQLSSQLEKEGLKKLYDEMEMPLITILSSMESYGLKIDTSMLAEYSRELTEELNKIEARARELSEEPDLNLSSPKQLGILLYEKLKITDKAKKTSKKNYSTDEETLTKLAETHPIVPMILEYRNLKKLLSTYIDPLPGLVNKETGKIHTTYNQSLTSTGRLSSVRPNLQNIPIRTERGRIIRKAFVPSMKQGVILSADYSQIELRIMAHMSKDQHFIEAFREGKDIHSATASRIFGTPEEQLTREQRSKAKVANFGIIYGISAFGLSQRLAISRNESKQLIEEYFKKYPDVERYMQESVRKAKEDGFVSTLYGRKRYLPDINSANQVVRGLAERNAINAPIQGTAADIIKMAMIKVYHRIKKEGLKSRMVLQVHDELVFDSIGEEADILADIVREEMENVARLEVPLTVECNWGPDWLEAH
jgi:DNA polymerase-1